MFEEQIVKVIIPALNEQESIGKVLRAIPDWVDEVIVVDNGSTDRTGGVAAQFGATVVPEPRRGYGQACLAGIAEIETCDILVFLDADFSDYPEEMELLVKPIALRHVDLVIGSRRRADQVESVLTPIQRFGNSFSCFLLRMIWRGRFTDLGPFRAIRWSRLRMLKMQDRNYGWTIEMQIKALRLGLRIEEAQVRYRRRIGQSKISGTVKGSFGAGMKILGTILRYAVMSERVKAVSPERLIVFTRYPIPGRTKTRLIPTLGAIGAAELQRRMSWETIRMAQSASRQRNFEIEVRYTGGTEREVRRWLGGELEYTHQGNGDLGQRLTRVFQESFAKGAERVVIIGTDCPSITDDHLRQAFTALGYHDLVLGPSADGGYWLIGLRREAKLFDGIAWGASTVLAATRGKAKGEGLSVYELETLRDVDTPEDVTREFGANQASPYLSVIIPTRNESSHIRQAIRSAQAENVEIIVVDGSSQDDTVPKALDLGVRVETYRPCRAEQMNQGVRLVRGQVLLFLHADTILPQNFARHIFSRLLDPQVPGGAFQLKTDVSDRQMRLIEKLVGFRAKHLQLPYGDQAIFVRRSAFETLGGFANVPLAEDLLFMRALKRVGRIRICHPTVITSGRRYRQNGLWRTTLMNQIIFIGCLLGISPSHFLGLYRKTNN